MTDFDNIQQNLNTPLVNNNDDIELSVKALPFIFNNDQNTKHNYNNNGNKIIKGWRELEKKYHLKIDIFGLPSLCSFKFLSKNNQKYKTYITQEMLKKGFLASNLIYSSVAHTPKIIDKYFYEIDKIFKIIQKCEDGYDIDKLLKFPVSSTGFQRIN